MEHTTTHILTVNTGSSSIKLDVFAIDDSPTGFSRIVEASVSGIGQTEALLTVRRLPDDTQTRTLVVADQAAAIRVVTEWLHETISPQSIVAIGYRIVHGGPNHSQPELVTDKLIDDLQDAAVYDPEHTPGALRLLQIMRQQYPHIPHITCFDTAFFQDMPQLAQLLPLPRKYRTDGLRRYGFHGLSYTYLLSAFEEMAGQTAARGRVIIAHLGSGVSLAALRDGKPVDTTMGFSPTSGVLMSSRSGDLDPGIIGYLHQKYGMSVSDFTHMVDFESGLLGVSGISADMYTLLQRENSDSRAAEAVNLFVYQLQKAIGALSATIGGLDSLVFSGTIGERSAELRGRVVSGLDYLGIALDETRNQATADLISATGSRVGVHVIATDEAHVITQHVIEVLKHKDPREE